MSNLMIRWRISSKRMRRMYLNFNLRLNFFFSCVMFFNIIIAGNFSNFHGIIGRLGNTFHFEVGIATSIASTNTSTTKSTKKFPEVFETKPPDSRRNRTAKNKNRQHANQYHCWIEPIGELAMVLFIAGLEMKTPGSIILILTLLATTELNVEVKGDVTFLGEIACFQACLFPWLQWDISARTHR